MENTDKSLIDAHRKGDPAAFGELVRRYGDSVLRYLTQMGGSRDQAEDFFQETFKRVHEKSHTFRGGQFKPWLFTIATHVAINGFRRANRRRTVSLNQEFDCADGRCGDLGAAVVADKSPDPSEEVVRAEQTRQVREAIRLLPAGQRAALVLAYYQQLSYRQVAEVMGCSVGTVKTQMYRALAKLAQKLPDVSGDAK